MFDITIKRNRKNKLPRFKVAHKKDYISPLARLRNAVSVHRPRITGFKVLNLKLPRIGFSSK